MAIRMPFSSLRRLVSAPALAVTLDAAYDGVNGWYSGRSAGGRLHGEVGRVEAAGAQPVPPGERRPQRPVDPVAVQVPAAAAAGVPHRAGQVGLDPLVVPTL